MADISQFLYKGSLGFQGFGILTPDFWKGYSEVDLYNLVYILLCMSDDVRLDFTVPNNVYNNGKRLVNENRNKTSNSRDSKAYYGRTIYKLGLEKLKELQKEKEEQAVDFRQTENRIKNLIEDKGLSEVV